MKVWLRVLTKEDYQEKYGIETHYLEDLETWLASVQPSKIFLNLGTNSDSHLQTLIPEEKYWSRYA